jgi:Ca2+-binding RTX toxin-like protein
VTGGIGDDLLDGGGDNDSFSQGCTITQTEVLVTGYFIDIQFAAARVPAAQRRLGIYGEDGNDKLVGGAGCDDMTGGAGDDWLLGGDAADRMSGDASFSPSDTAPGSGRDRLDGGAGDDLLLGQRGSDRTVNGAITVGPGGVATTAGLYGGTGNDRLHGGAGDDLLDGGPGSDLLKGGDPGESDSCTNGETVDTSCRAGAAGLPDDRFQWSKFAIVT